MVLLSSTKPTNLPPFFLSFSSISSSHFCNSSLSFSTIPSFSSFAIRSHLLLHPLSSSHSIGVSSALCRSSRPGRPPPRRVDPPPGNDSRHLIGFAGALVRLQDRVRIFFAVLFWMSLFFWASAWDGRNRPNKGSRFKKMK
ncbi:uncharacterized protein LOC129288649 [Prosopis cineraria]|uniref:uncharacterized protein LOC129288649 n=1 Tax=Prosopis cineraria TaxID=364024 RepID=UPI00240F44F1|nr:uncharacterized protein LOC129288649 [Prosopis cineraria]